MFSSPSNRRVPRMYGPRSVMRTRPSPWSANCKPSMVTSKVPTPPGPPSGRVGKGRRRTPDGPRRGRPPLCAKGAARTQRDEDGPPTGLEGVPQHREHRLPVRSTVPRQGPEGNRRHQPRRVAPSRRRAADPRLRRVLRARGTGSGSAGVPERRPSSRHQGSGLLPTRREARTRGTVQCGTFAPCGGARARLVAGPRPCSSSTRARAPG